jgi:hypothetical protein
MYVGGKLVHIQDSCDLVDMYSFLKETYRAEYLIRWLFYVGMPVSAHDASVMCLDPNLFLLEADSKDPVVPVCHRHTPAIGYLANHAT